MTKQELLVDFITSLDGYGAAEGWPGFWGLEGPEYLGWLGEAPERDYTILMGATRTASCPDSPTRASDEEPCDELTNASKVVFSSTLQPPLLVAQYPADPRGCGRGCEKDEAGRQQLDAHHWQPQLVPVAPQGRPRGSFPGGRLPRDHREHRLRPDLRRLSRCRPRYDCQPDVRRQTPTAGVCAQGAYRTAGREQRFLTVRGWRKWCVAPHRLSCRILAIPGDEK